MPKKKKMPKDLVSKPLEQNINWVNEFIKNDPKPNKQNFQLLSDFFSYIEISSKPFNEYTMKDIEKYIVMLEEYDYKPQSISTRISCINKFNVYMEKHHRDLFTSKDLVNINTLRKHYEPLKAGQPFNLTQLSYIRTYNNTDFKSRLCFELLFQLGIDKNDLRYCKYINLDKNKWAFKKPNGELIFLNESIKEIMAIRLSQHTAILKTVLPQEAIC